MRDTARKLYEAWEEGLTGPSLIERAKRRKALRSQKERKKPRGNGALKDRKQ